MPDAISVATQSMEIEVEPWEHGEDDPNDGSDRERDG